MGASASRSPDTYEQIKKFMITMIRYFGDIFNAKEDEDLLHHWFDSVDCFENFICREFNSCDHRAKRSMNGSLIKDDLTKLHKVASQVRDKLPPVVVLQSDNAEENRTDGLYKFLSESLHEIQVLFDEVDQLITEVKVVAQALASIDIFKTPDMNNVIQKLKKLSLSEPAAEESCPDELSGPHGPPRLRIRYSDSGAMPAFVDAEETKGYKTVLREITGQLNGVAERVQELLLQEDFVAIAIGVSSIRELKGFEPLKSLSDSVLPSVHDLLVAHGEALMKEFVELFKKENSDRLQLVISNASARDRDLGQLIRDKFVPPLLDAMISTFQMEIADMATFYAQRSTTAKQHAQALVALKKFVSGISHSAIQKLANDQISRYVDKLTTLQENVDFFELAAQLVQLGPLGRLIISDSPKFAEVARESMANAVIQAGMTLDHALAELKRLNPDMTDLQIDTLRKHCVAFDGYFKNLLRLYIPGYEGNFYVRSRADLAVEVSRKADSVKGNVKAMDLVEILAGVFAYWSLLSTAGSSSSTAGVKKRRQVVVMEPHVIQLLAIFQLLKLDKPTSLAKSTILWIIRAFSSAVTDKTELAGHLIQVLYIGDCSCLPYSLMSLCLKCFFYYYFFFYCSSHATVEQLGTGEGKSILLGGLSCLLALLGFNVYCACYSKHLSSRDYLAFREIIQDLGLLNRVHYSTLAGLAESIINKDGDLRDMVRYCCPPIYFILYDAV